VINQCRKQDGVVLVVSLLLLLVVTLLAVSTLNTGIVDLRIVDNMRAQQEAEAAAQQAIERILGDVTKYDMAAVAEPMDIHGTQVQMTAPACLRTAPAKGDSALNKLAPEDTVWGVIATVETAEGARAVLHQGVAIRMVANSCP